MAFREMRKKDKQVFSDLVSEILYKGEYGVLSTMGENGFPYGVPVNYVYFDNCIFFHSAKTGHKIDAINGNDKVSFCVVTDTKVLPERFSSNYKSVIAFGTASIIEGKLKHEALIKLIEKYSAEFINEGREYVKREASDTLIVKIEIQHMTGKASL